MAFVFLVLFVASVFVVFYLKDYFFIQSHVDLSGKQSLTSLKVIEAINDTSIELYDYHGKSLNRDVIYGLTNQKEVTKVFHFWASWCDPCAIELPELISYAKKINATQDSGAILNAPKGDSVTSEYVSDQSASPVNGASAKSSSQIYLISLDSEVDGLNKFAKIFPEILSKNFIQVWDKSNALSSRYSVDKLPMTIFVFPDGKLEIHEGVVNWKNLPL